MLLCIDVGNSNITLGLYNGKQPDARWRLATNHRKMPDEFGVQLIGLLNIAGFSPEQVVDGILASVVPPLTSTWVQACQKYLGFKPMLVDSSLNTGVKIRVDNPQQVGADRIVDAAAAFRLFGGPACIVDFGTATTFDAISSTGEYLGGAIAPGIEIATEALAQKAAKLPKIDLHPPPSPIGKNTVHAMQSGLLLGYISLVEGMVTRFRKILGPEMRVIATGGLAELIARETEVLEIVAPWLTLDGLQMIYEMNAPQQRKSFTP